MEKTAFSPADILLPYDCGLTKWAVVACDQYTSQPEYWERVDQYVGDAPSTLRLILPESKLESDGVDQEIQKIHATMEQYLQEERLRPVEDAMLFVERKLANGKTSLSFGEAFWRAVGCNWLVCLAVYLSYAAKETAGKILSLWFPTMAFVAMGMEHCVANMFFVPAAIFTGTDPRYTALVESGAATALTADWSKFFIDNLIPVTLGNIVGGAVLVAMIYAIIHGKLRNS